jgi:hypothetical protein
MRAVKRPSDHASSAAGHACGVQASLTEAQDTQARTQESYDNSQAALESMKRKLQASAARQQLVVGGLALRGLSHRCPNHALPLLVDAVQLSGQPEQDCRSGSASLLVWPLSPLECQPSQSSSLAPPQVYKKENKNLMSSYDDWLKQMVKTRPGAAAGQ